MASSSSTEHVNAIDGIRAIAVVAIILFHLDATWLPGGFVGVDIFFVISGFVVAFSVGKSDQSSLLTYFLAFYRRRLVRIYPVLLVFILVTLAASTLLVPMADNSKFIEPTGAAAVFGVSNVLLWLKTGDYFATASEYNLFTHTWSLGVEEQYYLLFPFFSYFILVRPSAHKPTLVGLVVTAAVMSLVACAWLSHSRPDAAFYLLPTRFWELATGFLLYVLCFGTQRSRRELPAWISSSVFSWLGVIGLGISILAADATAFPFPWAVLPTLATAALILSAVLSPQQAVARLLSSPIPRWIGRISFSLYLWHWAVIVLMKWTIGIDTLFLKALAAGVTLTLSVASFYLVEDPARRAGWLKRLSFPAFYASAAAALFVVATLGVAAFFYKPAVSLSATAQQAVWDPYERYSGGECGLARQMQTLGSGLAFTYGPRDCVPKSTKIFVMGDSHAGAYNRLFERLAADEGYAVINYTMGGCKLIDGLDPVPIAGCPEFRAQALEAIAKQAGPSDVVFFAGHYTRRYRDAWHASLLTNESIVSATDDQIDAAVSEVDDLLAPLLAKGVRVVLEGPKPI